MSNSQLTQASSLFAFLKDILRLRHKPIKTLDSYSNAPGGWVHHLDETPETKNGIEFWSSLGIKTVSSLQGDVLSAVQLGVTTFKEMKGAILRFPRVTISEPPQPSERLGAWIDGDIEDALVQPELLEFIDEIYEDGQEIPSGEGLSLDDFPDVQNEFDSWLAKWNKWAQKVQQDQAIRRIYNSLFEARNVIKENAQDWEFVLGVGRLRLGIGTDKQIDRHLFTTPCTIDLDSTTGTLFVRIDDSASFSIEDDWILGFEKPEKDELDSLKEIFDQTSDLEDPVIKKSLIQLAHNYRPELATDAKKVDVKKTESLLLAPTLILRKRGKQDLITLIENLEGAIGTADELPAPLKSLLEPGYGDRSSTSDWSGDGAVVKLDDSIYLPLTLNKKQIQALEKADTRNATLIQGPPGTGKTRTIAVMVSHFLAKGQRVLVAAETSQALREVRTQLPDEIRDLAVASLGGGKTDNDDLQKAVNALVEAHENRAELSDGFESFEQTALSDIDKLHEERAGTIRKIIDLRSKEATKIDIEGYFDSPANLAQIYLSQRQEYSWLTDLSDSTIMPNSFTVGDAEQLIEKLQAIWSTTLTADSALRLPPKEELWTEEAFKTAKRFKDSLKSKNEEFSLSTPYAEGLLVLLEKAIDLENQLNANPFPWINKAISDAATFAETGIREKLDSAAKMLEEVTSILEKVGDLSEIEAPITEIDWLPLIANLIVKVNKKGDLKTSATGEIKKPLIGNNLSNNAFPKLNQVKINGKSPSSSSDLTRVEGLVAFDQIIRKITDFLDIPMNSVPQNRIAQAGWLNIQSNLLKVSLLYCAEIEEVKKYLSKKLSRTSTYLQQNLNLKNLHSFTLAITAEEKLESYERELNLHKASVKMKLKGAEYEFVSDYLAALSGNDLNKFTECLSVMMSYVDRQSLVQEVERYAAQFFGQDTLLMNTIRSWTDSTAEEFSETKIVTRILEFPAAIRWKRLGHTLGSQVHDDYSVLFRDVNRCDNQIEAKMRLLSKRRSWKKALDRISAATVSDMERYAFETRKYGKGTGTTAPQRKKEIRKYLERCIPAIPAWITPISNVAKLFPAQLELFDVVIVDEASQARLDSIFLLALCKRVVIVGDHKQVSPDKAYMKDSEIQAVVKRHLAGETRAANWANPDISLFDECKMAFGGMVTLTEHRRCVPEIIGFSNQIAYIPENIRLIPVRQTGSQSLPPVKTVFVPNGYVRGNGGSIVNPPEAEALVAEVARMIKDPSYRGKTFGIITLQGDKQRELLEEKLRSVISLVEIEKRQIKVDKPSGFQGSERDVILLSMVMAPGRRSAPQTQENMVQRYNVAMSRAKDQVVLVHSLRASDLTNQKDLRRQLIDYCLRIESGSIETETGIVGLVSDSERDPRFDSLFEQRVHNQIVGRGFKVIPQYEPQIDGHDYRIDLVVVGAAGKFAIECDGDFWHGPEEYERDLDRQQTMERCGWRFFRIPESKFYADSTYLDPLWPLLDDISKMPEVKELKIEDNLEHDPDMQVESQISSETYEDFEDDAEAIVSSADAIAESESDQGREIGHSKLGNTDGNLGAKSQEEKPPLKPTMDELIALRNLRLAEASKTDSKTPKKFPSRAELEKRRKEQESSESDDAQVSATASEDPLLESAEGEIIRGSGIGESWLRSKGKFKLLLSHKEKDLLDKRDGEVLDKAFSGKSRAVAELWLEIRPSGGRVFLDSDGNACTYQGTDLIFLGNVQHLFNPKFMN